MRFAKASIASLAFASVASALPAYKREEDCSSTQVHVHHKHKREVVYEYAYVTVTVDGSGSLRGSPSSASSEPTSSTASFSSVEPTTSSYVEPTTSSYVEPSTSSSPSSSSAGASTSSSGSVPSGDLNGIWGDLSDYSGPSNKFEDGVHSCDSFPEGNGVISLSHLGFGGWSGIYNSDTSTGGKCSEGSYCSYACQSGMSKTQWPSDQPSNGVSIGGLLCKNGKLYRTNKDTNYLCEWGKDSAIVENKLSKEVSICRTDYPGTENMVIPTVSRPGKKIPLTTVNSDTYYEWRGKSTSAQYYVNDAGVGYKDGCLWGSSGSGVGNWAPLNFGAGWTNGIAYLSLIPNPNNKDETNYSVKIVADDNSNVNGECVYKNGKYNGDGTDGCTVAVTSGRAKFVFY
ncbi:uncharacterized protein CXQ87_004104 [Candidozyma duobushaemuli]|uniref:Uncharacterized protein n=2 Tax=Candidozyma TaxID=3303203 RepID=A0ABX8I749_9ASCO|nr:uncharacterized protein CXQ87_004104 [[Candida] duobushaemulonis]PVH16233.1 hypothetical protein CXQ87_004104 [[Candida] duobushaemulonis]QWU89100.1 hypothetical protein CA3LBN_003423 [[Candida] haemuloni]